MPFGQSELIPGLLCTYNEEPVAMDLGSAGMETPHPEWVAGPFVCWWPPGHKLQAASAKLDKRQALCYRIL